MLRWLFAHPAAWFLVVLVVWCVVMGGTAWLSDALRKPSDEDDSDIGGFS